MMKIVRVFNYHLIIITISVSSSTQLAKYMVFDLLLLGLVFVWDLQVSCLLKVVRRK